MTKRKKGRSAKTLWLTVTLGVPLFPFLVKVLIRFISFPHWGVNLFDASDLALISGFTWLFVRQSLVDTEITLSNEDKKNEVNTWAHYCFGFAIFFFAFYLLIEVFNTLVIEHGETDKQLSLNILRGLIFSCFAITVPTIMKIQNSFKLKAKTR